MTSCQVEDCVRPVRARGFCHMHHERWRKHGDASVVLPLGVAPKPKLGASPHWVGDNAGYAAVHKRLNLVRGKARLHMCPCGKQAAHWAFDEPTGYSADLDRYTALCVSCHRFADAGSQKVSV